MYECEENSPLKTIRFRPLPRFRPTEHARPLKTIHIAPPPRRSEDPLCPIETIHFVPRPRPS